jgi:hypothetical protein
LALVKADHPDAKTLFRGEFTVASTFADHRLSGGKIVRMHEPSLADDQAASI